MFKSKRAKKRLSHGIQPPVANTQPPHEVIDIIDVFLVRLRCQEDHGTPSAIAVGNLIVVLKGLDFLSIIFASCIL